MYSVWKGQNFVNKIEKIVKKCEFFIYFITENAEFREFPFFCKTCVNVTYCKIKN